MFGFESKYPGAWSRMQDAGADGMIPDYPTFKADFGSPTGPFSAAPRLFPLMRVTPKYVREFASYQVMPMRAFTTNLYIPGSLVFLQGDEHPNGWPLPKFTSSTEDDSMKPDYRMQTKRFETLEETYADYISYIERELRLAENLLHLTPITPYVHKYNMVPWEQVNYPNGMLNQIRSGRQPRGVIPRDASITARSSSTQFPGYAPKEAYLLAMYREMMLHYCWKKVDRDIFEAIQGGPLGGNYAGSGRVVPDLRVEDLPVYLDAFKGQ
jgi:hypothetical protein